MKITECRSIESDDPLQEIKQTLLAQLGKPPHLAEIRIIPLYADRYRVNVYCSHPKPGCLIDPIQIDHSYFVNTSGDEMLFSPAIVRRYR